MGATQSATLAQLPNVESSWRVQIQTIAGQSDLIGCTELNTFKKTQLYVAGLTKAICPFGVLIMGTASYPDSYLHYTANIVSNILDQNNDGIVDNPILASNLGAGTFWLMAGGDDATEEARAKSKIEATVSFNGIHLLKAYTGNGDETDVKRIIQEEVMHFFTLRGWAQGWPAKFGVADFTSDLCQEMASLECKNPGWQHPENTCDTPGQQQNPPLVGSCSEAKCDCVEFFHQAVAIRNSQSLYWKSASMPSYPLTVNTMLTTDFKNTLSDATYGIPQAALSGLYDVFHFQNAQYLSMASSLGALYLAI